MFKYIARKIRLFFNRKKEPYLRFYAILGFYPDDIDYYRLAIRHRSMPLRTPDGRKLCNERLEFLGDAILSSVITDILYKRFENESEGFLTNLRSKIVSRESLNRIAVSIGLDKLVLTSSYVNRYANNNIYGNALEALFGAVYLDQGYRRCKAFVEERLFSHILDWDDILEHECNFKSKVLEWCNKRHLDLEFVLLDETVVKNKHTFHTCLKIQDTVVCEASGSSKKESQQRAAQLAYCRMCEDETFWDSLKKEACPEKEETEAFAGE